MGLPSVVFETFTESASLYGSKKKLFWTPNRPPPPQKKNYFWTNSKKNILTSKKTKQKKFRTFVPIFFWIPFQINLWTKKKKKWDPPENIFLDRKKMIRVFFSSFLHGNAETIRIGREIQWLPYAGFCHLSDVFQPPANPCFPSSSHWPGFLSRVRG